MLLHALDQLHLRFAALAGQLGEREDELVDADWPVAVVRLGGGLGGRGRLVQCGERGVQLGGEGVERQRVARAVHHLAGGVGGCVVGRDAGRRGGERRGVAVALSGRLDARGRQLGDGVAELWGEGGVCVCACAW